MNDPEPQNSTPGATRMTVGQIALLIVGIILLLPGACSLFFMISLIAEKPSRPFSDPYVEIFYVFWIASFIVSAIGVALIYAARKKARTTGPDIQ